MKLCQLGEIYAVAWSTGGALHRSYVGEGADRSDRVRRDFDPDLIASQFGEARDPLHSVQHLHLAVLGLNLEAGRRGECGSGERSIDRMFPPERLEAFCEAVHVSLIRRGNDVDVRRGPDNPCALTASPSTITHSTPAALRAATTRSGSKTGSALIDAPAVREPQCGAACFDHQPDSAARSEPTMDGNPHRLVPGGRLGPPWISLDTLVAHDASIMTRSGRASYSGSIPVGASQEFVDSSWTELGQL
jgi:hypothetical protein